MEYRKFAKNQISSVDAEAVWDAQLGKKKKKKEVYKFYWVPIFH